MHGVDLWIKALGQALGQLFRPLDLEPWVSIDVLFNSVEASAEISPLSRSLKRLDDAFQLGVEGLVLFLLSLVHMYLSLFNNYSVSIEQLFKYNQIS